MKSATLCLIRHAQSAPSAETIAACSHRHVIGLFLHHLGERSGRQPCEALRNPDG